MDLNKRSEILRNALNTTDEVLSYRPLSGGMINTVEEWTLSGRQSRIVAKISDEIHNKEILIEYENLKYYREHTRFPVPEPYALLDIPEIYPGSILLMEWIDGQHLGQTRLSASEADKIEREMATHLANLHQHTRQTYGNAVEGPKYERFLDYYEPVIRYEFEYVRDLLNSEECQIVESVLDHLPEWLPERGTPRLIHGDIWATNVMIGSNKNGTPYIKAFIDGAANFRDREQELAYLRIFSTVGASFFAEYQKHHPIHEGFDRRCRVFWLNTWLRHVRKFGTGYLAPSRRTIMELKQLQ